MESYEKKEPLFYNFRTHYYKEENKKKEQKKNKCLGIKGETFRKL